MSLIDNGAYLIGCEVRSGEDQRVLAHICLRHVGREQIERVDSAEFCS
jgi:hypothetical protein